MKEVFRHDYDLVRKALAGDRYAFEEVVNRYQSQVAKTVIAMLGNTAEAEDTGQEVFIRFFRSMKQFEGDSSLGTYLTRIAINLSLNELKKRKTKPSEDIDDHGYRLTSDDQFRRSETADMINRALQQLEPEFRSVVVLRMIHGYSSEETAKILGIATGTVLSRLSRARLKLRNIISREMEN